jgi:hypothetical protein
VAVRGSRQELMRKKKRKRKMIPRRHIAKFTKFRSGVGRKRERRVLTAKETIFSAYKRAAVA